VTAAAAAAVLLFAGQMLRFSSQAAPQHKGASVEQDGYHAAELNIHRCACSLHHVTDKRRQARAQT
jgi:ABC-type nickel/cobalt efflux system permease component RcnA